MNQILSTNDKKSNSVLGLKPIISFFAIILIVIALIFAGQSGYKLYKSIKYKQEYPRAELQTEQFGSVLNLKFTDSVVISKIEYSWDNGNITEIKGIGKTKVDIDIDIPQNDHILNVSVTDVDGNKTKFENIKVSFTEADIVNEKDRIQPVISIEKSSNAKKFIITVKDNKELDYISYTWEDGQPTIVRATEETKLAITEEIVAQKGTKKITVKAVDKAGNESTKSRTIIGSEGPKVSASIKNDSFAIKVKSENGITKIKYKHNEVEHEVTDIPKDSKEFEFLVPLQKGENYLIINAYEEDIMTEYKCKKTKQ